MKLKQFLKTLNAYGMNIRIKYFRNYVEYYINEDGEVDAETKQKVEPWLDKNIVEIYFPTEPELYTMQLELID